MTDLTPFEAELDAINEKFEKKQQEEKASIIGSAVEMDWVISHTDRELRLEIMGLIANLTDSGLELDNPKRSEVLPSQVAEMVADLARAIENAIEEFIDDE